MHKHQIILVLISFFVYSCSDQNRDLSTYTVTVTNFENAIVIDGVVEPVNTTTLTCPRNIDGVVIFLVEDGTIVDEGEVVCIIEDKERQGRYDDLIVEVENAEANISKVKADLEMQYAMLEAQVKNNEADTQIAQLDSLQLKYSAETQRKMKELELEKVSIEKNKYEKKLAALAIINQSEIRKLELNFQRLKSRLESTKKELDDLTLRASKKGLAMRGRHYVTDSKIQVGDPVWGNMPLIILPEFTKMKVKIMASERDYKYINVNDSVCYTFDAMPQNIAFGKILKKAPVSQPYKENSKVKFFEVEASIDSTAINPDPGFTANCRVIVHSVKDTIVIPQISIFDEDSIKVVYVKNKNNYEMRQILTGLSSPKEAIITEGLRTREIISLTKPPSSMIKDRVMLPDSIAKPKH